jgi:hypothetical protein
MGSHHGQERGGQWRRSAQLDKAIPGGPPGARRPKPAPNRFATPGMTVVDSCPAFVGPPDGGL